MLRVLLFVLLPATAWAQAVGSGNIAGVVRDESGAVLPGVTVEAASPALIEKVRVVVTDDQVLVMTTRYGPAWQNATSILAPRLFKLGVQVSF